MTRSRRVENTTCCSERKMYRGSPLREDALHEPFAVVDTVTMIAIDPHELAARRLGDEVVATDVGAVPPSRFDPLGAVAQHPGLRFEELPERRRFRKQPDGTRRKRGLGVGAG